MPSNHHTSRPPFLAPGLFVTAAQVLLLASAARWAAAGEFVLSAGTAKMDITPTTRIPMSGYGSRKEPFQAVHDKIFARAVVFRDERHTAAIVAADVIGFSHEFWSDLAERLQREVGIEREHLLLCAAHNHGGPVTRVYNESDSPEVIAYVAELQSKLAAAVQEATNRLRPVRIGAGAGVCNMNINRRARHPTQGIALGRNPDGPCDHEVSVVRIDNQDGTPVSLLFNWPCHGTVLGPRNYDITGDWPGAAARFVEEAFEGEMTAPVTIGASGDINPIYGPHIDFHEVNAYAFGLEAIGMILGEEVVRVARGIAPGAGGPIRASQRVVQVPAKAGDEPTLDIRLTVLKIGTVVFAGVSGEVFNEIGVEVKRRSPYKHTMVVTHCNGSSGYLVTDKAYAEGGYEVRATRAKAGAEKAIVETLEAMINEL
jgi:hypothetical protein